MSKKWRLTDRTRTLLTLELAIVLPAAALMAFSILNLKNIQRNKAIEAAIEHDFIHVLKIAEKKSLERANDLLAPVLREFPNAEGDPSKIKAKLEHILSEHPELAYAVLYDKKSNLLLSRIQPGRDRDAIFCGRTQDEINSAVGWATMEAPDMASHVRIMAEKGEQPVGLFGGWSIREMQRTFADVFPSLVLAIKYQGTTIADMGMKFLRFHYTVLAVLCLLMVGGIWLTYRNVSREMNLARLKSDFVANVSHELRTPLALIRLYAETLELGRLTAKETNLADLVRSTLDSYRFQIEQNGFAFEENISGDIPPVIVDREAIARSLLNLVNNALKYSKDQKYIGVSLYRANSKVNLEVRD